VEVSREEKLKFEAKKRVPPILPGRTLPVYRKRRVQLSTVDPNVKLQGCLTP
jgi:hypothetical protein